MSIYLHSFIHICIDDFSLCVNLFVTEYCISFITKTTISFHLKLFYQNTLRHKVKFLDKGSPTHRCMAKNCAEDNLAPLVFITLMCTTGIRSYIWISQLLEVGGGRRIHWLHLCRGVRPPSTSVLDTTLHCLMLKLQLWRVGECRVPLYCHHSQVHTGPEWLYLIGPYLWVK